MGSSPGLHLNFLNSKTLDLYLNSRINRYMSRSSKKNPYISTACHSRGSMKKWKRQCNARYREYLKNEEEPPSLNHNRKFVSRWAAPDDGKYFWENPKAYRK